MYQDARYVCPGVLCSYKTPGIHTTGQRAPSAFHRSIKKTAPHGTSYIPGTSIRHHHRIQVSPIGHNASNSLNKTTAGTSHQDQVPDLTAQEVATHHKPFDSWDIATSPLPTSRSATGAPRSIHAHLDDIKPSSTRMPSHPNSEFKLSIHRKYTSPMYCTWLIVTLRVPKPSEP